MPAKIVRATVADIAEIADMERRCFPFPWSYDSIYYELSNPIAESWVALVESGGTTEEENNNKYVYAGYINYRIISDEIHIGNIAVLPQFRRRGIARALINRLFTQAKAHQADKITLEVRVSNTAAATLYQSLGFEAAGIRKEYYEDGEDALIMWRYDGGQINPGRQDLL